MRHLYSVLAPQSLPYAELGLASLLRNAIEPLSLTLITDSAADRQQLQAVLQAMPNPQQHPWNVVTERDGDARAAELFAGLPHLQKFRQGHPCWRKVTDPLLFSPAGEEIILLDPDVYFPNRFSFEPTPEQGILLMWQPPNCLFPPAAVRAALAAPVKLANHVDIGVAQLRSLDLEWLNWLIGRMGGSNLPRAMHIEAIVWSALLMRQGGGHLDPTSWHCWHRSHLKRLRIKLGSSGTQILQQEKWSKIKCFHGGGMAKWWFPEAEAAGLLSGQQTLDQPSPIKPLVELSAQRYELEQRAKNLLSGYYTLINPEGKPA
jgi:hypothetical protein